MYTYPTVIQAVFQISMETTACFQHKKMHANEVLSYWHFEICIGRVGTICTHIVILRKL